MNLKLNVAFLFFYILFFNIAVYYGLNKEQILVTKKGETYKKAVKLCFDLGLNLIRIESDLENNDFFNIITNIGDINPYWIDGNNKKDKNVWFNSDNEKLKYTKWKPNYYHVVKNNTCIQVRIPTGEKWKDVDCTNEGLVICSAKQKLLRNNILVTDRILTFPDARDYCKKKGLKLIRIKNDIENNLIHKIALEKKIGTYWIDGNNFNFQKAWINLDNEPLKYIKWHVNVSMYKNFREHCIQGNYYKSSEWDHETCYKGNAVICYANQTIWMDNLYNSHKIGTFDDAERHCKILGLNLIRIRNDMENYMVQLYASKTGIRSYWIDGNNINFQRRWLDMNNEALQLIKFHINDNMNKQIEEHCIVGSNNTSDWDHIPCDRKNTILCYAKKLKLYSGLIILSKKSNFEEAQRYCKNIGLNLLRVENEIENIKINNYLNATDIKTYWLDGNNFNIKSIWLNSDNEPLLYTKWHVDNFKNIDNVKHCIIMNYKKAKEWKYEDCSKENSIICYEK